MRLAYALLAGMVVAQSGCSIMIAQVGNNLNSVTTYDEVHRQYSNPVSSEIVDGRLVEEFRTRQKLVDRDALVVYGTLDALTFGLYEFVAIPMEVRRVFEDLVDGREFYVTYYANGHVASIDRHKQQLDTDQSGGGASTEIDPEAAKKADVP